MICSHTFTTVNQNFDITVEGEVIQGSRMVCVFCGQVRDVFSTGEVFIRKVEGRVSTSMKYESNTQSKQE